MNYKEYVSEQYDRALDRGTFDPNGNSVVATCKRGFFKQMLKTVKIVNNNYIGLVKSIPQLIYLIITTLWLILFPITYPITLVIVTVITRYKANREMRQYFIKDKADKLHK